MDFISKQLKIYCDNTSVTLFSNKNKNFSVARYMQIKYLVIKERVWDHLVSIEQINTKVMIVDPMTKALALEVLKIIIEKWVVLC